MQPGNLAEEGFGQLVWTGGAVTIFLAEEDSEGGRVMSST